MRYEIQHIVMIYAVLQRVYDATIRDWLPVKNRTLNGVKVRDTPILDRTADRPNYKEGLISAIHDNVSEGDTVEIVGFGRGVSTVHILQAGASKVIAHEAAKEMIKKGIQTLENNEVKSKRVTVRHSVIGEPVDIYGVFDEAEVISPEKLTDADVLVLDCEGSEISILDDLGTWPDTIICETHPGEKGAPTEDVTSLLERYDIEIRDYVQYKDSDKDIVTGMRSN